MKRQPARKREPPGPFCLWCGDKMAAKRVTRRFCSTTCRVAAYRSKRNAKTKQTVATHGERQVVVSVDVDGLPTLRVGSNFWRDLEQAVWAKAFNGGSVYAALELEARSNIADAVFAFKQGLRAALASELKDLQTDVASLRRRFRDYRLESAPVAMTESDAWSALDFFEPRPWIEVKKRFKALTLSQHPDRGGDPEKFRRIVSAFKRLEELYGSG